MIKELYVLECDCCKISHTYSDPKTSVELAESQAFGNGWEKLGKDMYKCPHCVKILNLVEEGILDLEKLEKYNHKNQMIKRFLEKNKKSC